MLILLVYWFILFLFASLSGIAFQNLCGLSKSNSSFTLLFGIIFQTLFLSFCAFFFNINTEVFILNCAFQIAFVLKYKSEFLFFLKSIFKSFSRKQFYLFFGLTLLLALKSAQTPTIFDNESYYIQTIKWLNEYGFVKGVANVHPFLAQFSFWHVLQSGFSFSFLPINFNDINGFIVLIGILYFIENYNKTGFNWTFFGILFLIFYYQFIDAPSPDLPILIFSVIIFNEFIQETKDVKTIFIFIIYMIFLKVTIAPILLLAIIYLFRNQKTVPFFGFISLFFGTIWIAKNLIITGYPLFPLSFLETNFDWKMSNNVLNKLAQITVDAGYAENLLETKNLTLLEKIKLWINLEGINSIFNKGILLLFLVVPFTKFFKQTSKFRILYFILLFHFIFLLVISPQYRFFLPTFILFSTIIIYEIATYLKFSIKNSVIIISLLLVSFSTFIDIKSGANKSTFALNQLIIPESITKYKINNFEAKKIENFYYNDPKLPNLYETSNGNLPCVNEKLFHYYNYFPQQRTNQLKDGFYAKELKQ
ncbi:LIC_10190 family membrane protein [Flavobacterium ponti]|uniref:LIC_10190 family membrane protein n=1 Tax=Flavobacterium ponti TaxID=665133 RepID=A0ABV9P7H3_9FLAO